MSRCCKFLDSPQSYHRSGNHYLVPGTFRHQLTSFRCVSVICVCCSKGCESVEGKRVLKQRGNTPNRPKGPAWLQTGIFLRLNVSESDFYARRRAFFLSPSLRGAENGKRPAQSIGCGRQSRGTGPRWMSGQHLFHLLAGSYQEKRCHTRWTGEAGEKEAFFSEFKKTCQLLFVL